MSTRNKPDAGLPAPLKNDPWLLKVQRFDYRRTQILLATARDLFSSAGVDGGSQRLLRLLAKKDSPLLEEHGRPLEILDLGCGVGSLGISIARSMPCGTVQVTLTDRDRLAVHVSRLNARANQFDPTDAPLRVLDAGPGYQPCLRDGVGPFDLIITNLPAKAGEGGIRHLLAGAGPLLRSGGALAFVHVTPLSEQVETIRRELEESGLPVEVAAESAGKEHRALIWRFPGGLPEPHSAEEIADLVPWRRHDVAGSLDLEELPGLPHIAVQDVEEFDSEHFRTPLLTTLAEREQNSRDGNTNRDRVLVLNPRHGFLAMRLVDLLRPDQLALLGRDTLELDVARINVQNALSRIDPSGRTRLVEAATLPGLPWLPAAADENQQGFDLIATPLLWKEGPDGLRATLEALGAALRPGPDARLLVAVGSGQLEGLKRLVTAAGLHYGRPLKRRGFVAIALRRA